MTHKRHAVDMGIKKRWKCVYDPENFFAGSFSTMEFELGLETGIWPIDSVWYNRKTKAYYHVNQHPQRFKNRLAMRQFIGLRRSKAEREKLPVAERQGYV